MFTYLESAGELYQLLEVDLTEMDTIVTNPADKACGEMALYDLLCWLTVRISCHTLTHLK